MKRNSARFDSLWINAHLLVGFSANHRLSIIHHGAIGVKDGLIAWTGLTNELTSKDLKQTLHVHDVKEQWILPGFIDCHTHLVYAGNRAMEFEMRLQGKSYTDIAKAGGGILNSVRQVREVSEKTLFNQSKKRLENLLREGVTALEIKSGYGLDLDSELKMLRVARRLSKKYNIPIQNTLLSAHAVPPEFKDHADNYIEYVCKNILPAAVESGLVDAVDVFCESIGFNISQSEKIFQAAKHYNLPVKMHAEQLTNMGGSLLAARYRALSVDHLEHLDEKSIQSLVKSKTVAVLLPGAFYYLREERKPPIDLLRRYKIPIAIATDTNPGTSPLPSLLLMMNMAAVLFRLTPEEILCAVTKNAARALGLAKTQGDLCVGKLANFVVWDISHPRDLVYSVQNNRCMKIIQSGEIQKRRQ